MISVLILFFAIIVVIACIGTIFNASSGAEALPALVIMGIIIFGLGGSIKNAYQNDKEEKYKENLRQNYSKDDDDDW